MPARCLSVIIGILLWIPCLSGLCYPDDEIVFHFYLMRGFHVGFKPGPDPTAVSMAAPITLRVRAPGKRAAANAFRALREEVGVIYGIPNIIGLTAGTMIWDGKRANLNAAVLASDDHLYFMQLSPHSLKGKILSLRIEAYKVRFHEIKFSEERTRLKRENRYGSFGLFVETPGLGDGVGGEKWLDAEVSVSLNEPVLLALPTGDQSCYLALQAYTREARQFSVGLVERRLFSFNVSDADPVSGRVVGWGDGIEKKDEAVGSFVYKGYTFLFGSLSTIERFQEDPDRYLRQSRIEYYVNSRNELHEINSYNPPDSILPRPRLMVKPLIPEAYMTKSFYTEVDTEVHVDGDGDVIDTAVSGSPPSLLTESVAAALRQWKFEPVRKERKSVAATQRVNFNFSLLDLKRDDASIAKGEGLSDLDSILLKCAEYCTRLEAAALHYICTERIRETIFPDKNLYDIVMRRWPPDRRKDHRRDNVFVSSDNFVGGKNAYVYDYQLIRKEGQVRERRILEEENGQLKHDAFSPLKTKRFYFHKPIFGPIGLLGEDMQKYYDYSLLEEEKIFGRSTWILEVVPRERVPGGLNHGRAWIDKEDASVLKMEVEAESLGGYERIQMDYVSRGINPLYTLELEFGLKNNGLCFPTRLICREAYADPRGRLDKVSTTDVRYQEYEFFTVKTEVKY